MIRIERDPEWWRRIAGDRDVIDSLLGHDPQPLLAAVTGEDVLPLASAHGGFLFVKRDPLGFVADLHTLFTPEGRGREALLAAVEALGVVWASGFQAVTTFEVKANPHSRPPRVFGFTRAGDWRDTPLGPLRLWILTREAWTLSPACRRHSCPSPSWPPVSARPAPSADP